MKAKFSLMLTMVAPLVIAGEAFAYGQSYNYGHRDHDYNLEEIVEDLEDEIEDLYKDMEDERFHFSGQGFHGRSPLAMARQMSIMAERLEDLVEDDDSPSSSVNQYMRLRDLTMRFSNMSSHFNFRLPGNYLSDIHGFIQTLDSIYLPYGHGGHGQFQGKGTYQGQGAPTQKQGHYQYQKPIFHKQYKQNKYNQFGQYKHRQMKQYRKPIQRQYKQHQQQYPRQGRQFYSGQY